jgi:hypothetical protein
MNGFRSEYLLVSQLNKKTIDNITKEMTHLELFLYNMYDTIKYYVCKKMITNKKVKWDDNKLCETSYTYSKQDYDRKAVCPSNMQNPVSNFADIFGNQV